MTENAGLALGSKILTETEAISYLRLDIDGPRDPRGTLKFYRQAKLLRGVRIGRQYRYPIAELEAFVQRLLDRKNDE